MMVSSVTTEVDWRLEAGYNHSATHNNSTPFRVDHLRRTVEYGTVRNSACDGSLLICIALYLGLRLLWRVQTKE